MNNSFHASLVANAISNQETDLYKSLNESLSLETFQDSSTEAIKLITILRSINDQISVDNSIIDEASSDYLSLGKTLVERLNWPNNSIRIFPQGSASTKTLVKSSDASKFDIDAVCSVDLDLVEIEDPMDFYKKIGIGLDGWQPEAKKRCWKVNFNEKRYYLEFTPSTPLRHVSDSRYMQDSVTAGDRYSDTALAVVDTPTESWKTSNPEGFSQWVNEQSSRPLLKILLEKQMIDAYSSESVNPVPDQEVEVTDTLRLVIRLLKRHRDMSVRRGHVDSELKPISIVIVTLLTQCYEGLADLGINFEDPLELITKLVTLMPSMIEIRNGKYWIANPTVNGENFAEKWNENAQLKDTFLNWNSLLKDDLLEIAKLKNTIRRDDKISEVFGCRITRPNNPSGSGIAPKRPSSPHITPPSDGLA